MRTLSAFRRSTYLTLAFASACLAQAEAIFFPELAVFVLPVILALGLAYFLDGRWALPNLLANLLGLVISICFGVWIAHQLVHFSARHGIAAPWWVQIMPFFGPVLMVLMLVKLFQPKRLEDYWMLHFIGLMQVVLGGVLASQLLFGALALAYILSGTWTLVLFYQAQARERVERAEHVFKRATPMKPPRPVSSYRVLGWSCGLIATAFGLFLITPHFQEESWDPFTLSNSRLLASGVGAGIDLNRVGTVRNSDRPAFLASARDNDGQPRALAADQYWIGGIMSYYEKGRWYSRDVHEHAERGRPVDRWLGPTSNKLADLGPRQYFVTITLDLQRVGRVILAEPVTLPPDNDTTTVALHSGRIGNVPLFRVLDGTMTQAAFLQPGEYVYRQVTTPPPRPGVGPLLQPGVINEQAYLAQPVDGIAAFTFDLLRRLRAEGKLSNADFYGADGLRVRDGNRLEVARALSNHLAFSGEYTYTLNLRRYDVSLDPTEDFLRHVKDGHCARYASALALMARSVGIPTRVVVGYHGADQTEQPGVFMVRQNQAHSWVEVLTLEGVGPDAGTRWVRLDPTPADESVAGGDSFWTWLRHVGLDSWNDYLLEYDASRRTELLGNITAPIHERWQDVRADIAENPTSPSAWLRLAPWLAPPAALLPLFWLWRRLRRRKNPTGNLSSVPLACYHRLLSLLERRFRIAPRPAQTPYEFACAARGLLEREPAAAPLADVPVRVVRSLYRLQYGRVTLDEIDCAALDQEVAALDAALTPPPPAKR